MSRENYGLTDNQQLELDQALWSKVFETHYDVPNTSFIVSLIDRLTSFLKLDSINEIKKLLAQGASASANGMSTEHGNNGWGNHESVLVTAANNGRADICALLIEKNPSIINEKVGIFSYSVALEKAASSLVRNKGHEAVVDLLFKRGAKLPPKDSGQEDSILRPYFAAIQKLGKLIDRPNEPEHEILSQAGNMVSDMNYHKIARIIVDSAHGNLEQVEKLVSTFETNEGLRKAAKDIFGDSHSTLCMTSFFDNASSVYGEFEAQDEKNAAALKDLIIGTKVDDDPQKFEEALKKLVSDSKIAQINLLIKLRVFDLSQLIFPLTNDKIMADQQSLRFNQFQSESIVGQPTQEEPVDLEELLNTLAWTKRTEAQPVDKGFVASLTGNTNNADLFENSFKPLQWAQRVIYTCEPGSESFSIGP